MLLRRRPCQVLRHVVDFSQNHTAGKLCGFRAQRRSAQRRSNHDDSQSPQFDLEAAEKTYNVSNLVLQLDALDNPYAKSHDEEDAPQTLDESQPWRWPLQGDFEPAEPTDDSLPFGVQPRKKNATPTLFHRVVHIPTEIDYMAVTLLGNPFDSAPAPTSIMNNLSGLAEIRQFAGQRMNNTEDFRFLLRSMDDASKIEPGMANTSRLGSKSHATMIINKLQSCRSISELRKATDTVSKTTVGCWFVACHGEDVSQIVLRLHFASHGSSEPEETLNYVNDLVIRVESKGHDVGRDLCYLGLYLACKLCYYPAVRRYLGLAAENQYPLTALGSLAIHDFSTRSRKNKGRGIRPASTTEWQNEKLKLLTGWSVDGIPSPDGKESRRPCVASLARQSYAAYWLYIYGLGEACANEALLHEHNRRTGFVVMPAWSGFEPAFDRVGGVYSELLPPFPRSVRKGTLDRATMFRQAFKRSEPRKGASSAAKDDFQAIQQELKKEEDDENDDDGRRNEVANALAVSNNRQLKIKRPLSRSKHRQHTYGSERHEDWRTRQENGRGERSQRTYQARIRRVRNRRE